jgi:hypothetical protein
MTPDTFATQPLRPRDRLEAWQEWHHSVLDVLSKHATGDEFPPEIHTPGTPQSLVASPSADFGELLRGF